MDVQALEALANEAAHPPWCAREACHANEGGVMHERVLVQGPEVTVDLASWVGFDGTSQEPHAVAFIEGNSAEVEWTPDQLRRVAHELARAADRMEALLKATGGVGDRP